MTEIDKVDTSNTADTNGPKDKALDKDELPSAHEQKNTQADSAVVDDEVVFLNREKMASSREDAAKIREDVARIREDVAQIREDAAKIREDAENLRGDAAHLREDALSLREQELHAAKMKSEPKDVHMIMLQQANAHLVVATIEAQNLVEQVKESKIELAHLAYQDVLTDLPNRMLLQDRLIQAIELAQRQDRQLAVIFLDLDRFKYINDSLGHPIGDKLLQSVALRLGACVRHSDTISRQGGDEFVVLLPSIEHAQYAGHCAQKILIALALPHSIDQHELQISASIGISIYPDDGVDGDALIKNADIAMYCAKESGRDNFKFFKQDMNDRSIQRHTIEAGLRNALERQEFVLHYQPKVNLHSGMIVGVEALIRWQHPEQGLLLPAQFVSIAEDCGLILPIGHWVLRQACVQAQAWRALGLPPIIIAINTSALEFRNEDFLENIRATLVETCMDACYLELELTESVLMRDVDATNAELRALAKLGVRIAVDDFGTGYSSLSYLRQFPINTLKIDQSFVSHLTRNQDDATIVSAVISMGKSLQKCVIAEGVETSEQCTFLLAQHCDEGQGYFFGRPMVAETLGALLQTGVPACRP